MFCLAGERLAVHDSTSDRNDRTQPGLRRLLTAIVATGLLLASPGGPQFVLAQASGTGASEGLAELRSAFSELRQDLDRTTFDFEALSFELAFEDAEGIIGAVRERIAFEQYRGVMRGQQGTLIDGAGNAYDQALLLANLLNNAGYEARIAIGELDGEQAAMLLAEIGQQERTEADLAELVERLPVGFDESALQDMAELAEDEASRLLAETDRTAAFLRQELAAAGVELPSTDSAELLQEATDYAWVEYRMSESDDWESAHVAFGSPPESLTELVAHSHLDGGIPEELQHRFRFQVLIEQRLGDELEVRPVTEAWERPVANLTGVPLSYVNIPDGAEEGLSVAEMLDGTTFFHPVFNGELAAGSQSFDANGSSAESGFTAAPAAGVFQTMGGLFGEAAGALAGEDDPSEFVTLTAQWLEYTFIAPGGEEVTHRRTVFDRIGLENRAAGIVELSGEVSQEEAVLSLTRMNKFMVSAGRLNDSYVLDQQAEATLAILDYAEAAAAQADVAGATPPTITGDAQDALAKLEHLSLYTAIDSFELPADAVSYRHEPGLIVFDSDATYDYARVDVVNNARRVLQTQADGLPTAAPELLLAAGVWETRIEGLPLTSRGLETLNTFTTFDAAAAEGVELLTITPADPDAVSQLQLPLSAQRAIEDDLAAGYVVISPVSVPEGSNHPAWWRVHAETGEALGRGGDGRGAEMFEYQMQIEMALARTGLAFSGVIGVGTCAATSSNPFQFSCCVWEATLITMGGAVLGAALSGAFAGAAIVMFVGLDVVGNTLLMAGSLADVIPSACSSLGAAGGCLLPLL